MNTRSYKTISANSQTVNKEWVLVDAKDKVLGRLCADIASILRGKRKANYTPHVDCGDNVVVINAEKVVLTGKKWNDKEYIRHTGYPGGQRSRTAKEVLQRKPEDLIRHGVKGMLPKTKLGNKIYGNLYVYIGESHDKQAQKPKEIKL